jgi:hypothetical protein
MLTFAELSTRIYCYLVYAMQPIGALIILSLMLNLCMKLWRKWQDEAIENYRVQQRFREMRKHKPLIVEEQEEQK